MDQIFISYGHKDAAEFAERLYKDLTAAGYEVWWDEPDIRAAERWDVRTEQGIRGSSVVLAVLTPYSTRDESVCRDEWAYALVLPRTVVPARLLADAKPTLQLVRRSWIDFTEDYDEGLRRLLDYLHDMDEGVLLAPTVVTLGGLKPLDFGRRLAELTQDFTGREWLNEEIDSWLNGSDKRAFVIVGEPGIGKSAIAAWLADTRDEQVAAIHLCTSQDSRTLDPYQFVASVVAQLHARVPEYAELVDELEPARRRDSAKQAFLELVVEPTLELGEGRDAQLILVDSLDEASTRDGETVADVLVEHADKLPAWLRVVTTTRPDSAILRQIEHLGCFELEADRPENKRDLRRYIEHRLSPARLAKCVQEADAGLGKVVSEVERISDGNFLVASCLLTALEEGDLQPGELPELSPELHRFYHELFRRWFPDIEAFDEDYYPLLAALSVAHEPLPIEIVMAILGCRRKEARRRLSRIGQLLQSRESGHALFHSTLQEWLLDPERAGDYWCDPDEAHRMLAGVLWQRYQHATLADYGRRSIPRHLTEARMLDELAEVVTNREFMEDLCDSGMSYDMAADYSRACFAVRELLAEQPGSPDRRRALASNHSNIADVLVTHGQRSAAIRIYRVSHETLTRLAEAEPENTATQRALLTNHNKMGDVLIPRRNLSGALTAYCAGLQIAECLAAADPGNAQWQRDLSVSHIKVGDALVAQGELSGGLEAYEASLQISEGLAASDPGNAGWQRDLWVLYSRIAHIMARTRPGEARQWWGRAYETLLSIKEAGMFVSAWDEGVLEELRRKIET